MPRPRNKSRPIAVRLPLELVKWVEEYAKATDLTKTEIIEAALLQLRQHEEDRRGKKNALIESLRRSQWNS